MPESEADQAGSLKWFDVQKAYGFIVADHGPDVFVHINVLRQYGIDTFALATSPGKRLRFKTAPGVVNDTPVAICIFVE